VAIRSLDLQLFGKQRASGDQTCGGQRGADKR